MATIGTTYREGKAMRMHLEAIDKKLRHDAERDRAQALLELERRSQENSRRMVAAARATGAVIDDVRVWVDHPSAEGRS